MQTKRQKPFDKLHFKHELDLTRYNEIKLVFLEVYGQGGEFKLDQILKICSERNLSKLDSFVFITHVIEILIWFKMLKRVDKKTFKRKHGPTGQKLRNEYADWLNFIFGAEMDCKIQGLALVS